MRGGGGEFDEMKQDMIHNSVNCIIFLRVRRFLTLSYYCQLQYPTKSAQVNVLKKTCYQQVDIRMRSHGLRQLVNDKSVESCQLTCCMLIVKTCYPQA